jgi:hypothetical protein
VASEEGRYFRCRAHGFTTNEEDGEFGGRCYAEQKGFQNISIGYNWRSDVKITKTNAHGAYLVDRLGISSVAGLNSCERSWLRLLENNVSPVGEEEMINKILPPEKKQPIVPGNTI